jgi:hypothetical protein
MAAPDHSRVKIHQERSEPRVERLEKSLTGLETYPTMPFLVPCHMGKLQDLQVINLSGNLGLTGTIPSSFKRLSSLEAIDVDGTFINT